MVRTRDLAVSLLVSGLAATAGAQSAYKVLDIYPGPQGSYPANFTRSGDVTFFTAEDPARGRELWRSDGTAAGTVLVKDIVAGPASSSPTNLTDVDGTLFFRIAGVGLGQQLWKSDGTAAGTVQVASLAPSGSNVNGFVAAGGVLFFSSNAGGTGQELWKSDGTAAGTVLVKDVAPGSASANPGGITAFGTGVVFAATLAGQGVELWKSDGTAAGTVQVADIAPGALSSSPSAAKVVSGGRVYFSATRTGNGRELWSSDGTAAGTLLVADLYPGASSSNPDQLAVSNGVVYFRAFEPTTGTELYRTDGTAAGTVRIADISPGTPSSYPAEFLTLGAHTIFTAGDDATVGTPELYRTDGTEAGTFILKDVNPGPQSSLPALLATLGARTYFSANDTVAGYELWRTDGTEEGTRLVRDIQAGSNSAFPGPAIAAGDTLLFRAEDAPLDAELWAVNGGAPEADAGPDQTVEDGEPVTLDGSASTDPQDDPITFEWRDASGTVLATTIAFTATFPRGIHEVTLVVGDGVNTGTDTVRVRVGRILDVVLVGEEGAGGTVTAEPGGTCQHAGGASTSCAFAYEDDQAVALTATPATGATFAGWEGACTGTEPCSVAMTESQVVTARFVPQRILTIDVLSEESGLGSIRIDPPGDLCPGGGPICERLYTQGDTVVLTPLPAPGSVFVGWNHPACPGTGTCTVTMDFNQFVGARFLGPRTLFVDVTGQEDGMGSVRLDPPGELCTLTTPGGTTICERSYTQGDPVVLTALPAPGSVFIGWIHPACPGTGTCSLSMDFHQVVGARFLGPRSLDVGVIATGDAAGSVRIDPPGTLCPVTTPAPNHCVETYAPDTVVQLTALPGPGTTFDGFGPPCTGTTPCTLTLAAASTVVQASFSRANQPPAVALTAPAPGFVVPPSATVALTASAADADGSVTRVAFFVDGFEVGASTTEPYGVLWTPYGPGPYTLSARATDDDGAVSDSAPVPVLVNAAPSIELLAPLPGATFVAPATVTLEADASDADGAIARVEFFEGATSRGFDTTSPYSVVWSNVTAGSHALTAVATDNHGATTALPFTVLVSARITPAADAHVRDGSHANTNYGGSSTLEARRNLTSGHTRWTYLRFPITALSTVGGARLRLLGRLTETTGSPVQAQVMAVANTSWSENGLTWNNKPALQPVPLATTALDHTSTAERWYEWDVTAYVQAEKAAGRTSVSFAVVEAANAPLASFRSRSATAASRPGLLLAP
jgi:ELWxxDGT repeat protein